MVNDLSINHNKKQHEYKHTYICIYILYITESLFCIPETNTTLQITYTSNFFFKCQFQSQTDQHSQCDLGKLLDLSES